MPPGCLEMASGLEANKEGDTEGGEGGELSLGWREGNVLGLGEWEGEMSCWGEEDEGEDGVDVTVGNTGPVLMYRCLKRGAGTGLLVGDGEDEELRLVGLLRCMSLHVRREYIQITAVVLN